MGKWIVKVLTQPVHFYIYLFCVCIYICVCVWKCVRVFGVWGSLLFVYFSYCCCCCCCLFFSVFVLASPIEWFGFGDKSCWYTLPLSFLSFYRTVFLSFRWPWPIHTTKYTLFRANGFSLTLHLSQCLHTFPSLCYSCVLGSICERVLLTRRHLLKQWCHYAWNIKEIGKNRKNGHIRRHWKRVSNANGAWILGHLLGLSWPIPHKINTLIHWVWADSQFTFPLRKLYAPQDKRRQNRATAFSLVAFLLSLTIYIYTWKDSVKQHLVQHLF